MLSVNRREKSRNKGSPHDHTTWAVISGVHGRERNVFYRRLPDATPGEGRLEKVKEQTAVRGGPAVTLVRGEIEL